MGEDDNLWTAGTWAATFPTYFAWLGPKGGILEDLRKTILLLDREPFSAVRPWCCGKVAFGNTKQVVVEGCSGVMLVCPDHYAELLERCEVVTEDPLGRWIGPQVPR